MTTLRSIDRSKRTNKQQRHRTLRNMSRKSMKSLFYERKTIYHTKFHSYSITIDDADPLVLMFVKKNKCMYEEHQEFFDSASAVCTITCPRRQLIY